VDFAALQQQLCDRQTTCVELTERYLAKIEKGVHLNAFIFVMRDQALQRAAEVDRKIAKGVAGRLAGMVIGVKDNLALTNTLTTCGSRILHNFVAPYDATVLRKLAQEDAIFIGKTNLDEFAMGSSSETSIFGAVKNPIDPQRVAGGSSGGSAAAVAAGMCTAALGSDTGGSIRQPASFCGIVGLKPTYGRVSRYGLFAYASSFDQIGPLTRTVGDSAHILQVIAGCDPQDSTAVDTAVPDYQQALQRSIVGLKIGLPREYFTTGLDPQVETVLNKTVEKLRNGGAQVVEVSLPHSRYAVAAYYILATAEASSNLERYDGMRYGYRAGHVRSLEETYVKSRSQGFGDEVKRRIMLGTYVLSAGYYDAYYRRAQQVRTLVKGDFDAALEQVDCLLTPTAPTPAFCLHEKLDDPLSMYLSDIYTVSVNLAGLPALSVPAGTDSKGLPIGAQFIARPFDEETLFAVGQFVQNP